MGTAATSTTDNSHNDETPSAPWEQTETGDFEKSLDTLISAEEQRLQQEEEEAETMTALDEPKLVWVTQGSENHPALLLEEGATECKIRWSSNGKEDVVDRSSVALELPSRRRRGAAAAAPPPAATSNKKAAATTTKRKAAPARKKAAEDATPPPSPKKSTKATTKKEEKSAASSKKKEPASPSKPKTKAAKNSTKEEPATKPAPAAAPSSGSSTNQLVWVKDGKERHPALLLEDNKKLDTYVIQWTTNLKTETVPYTSVEFDMPRRRRGASLGAAAAVATKSPKKEKAVPPKPPKKEKAAPPKSPKKEKAAPPPKSPKRATSKKEEEPAPEVPAPKDPPKKKSKKEPTKKKDEEEDAPTAERQIVWVTEGNTQHAAYLIQEDAKECLIQWTSNMTKKQVPRSNVSWSLPSRRRRGGGDESPSRSSKKRKST